MSRPRMVFFALGALSLALTISALAAASSQSGRADRRIDTRIVFQNNHLCSSNGLR